MNWKWAGRISKHGNIDWHCWVTGLTILRAADDARGHGAVYSDVKGVEGEDRVEGAQDRNNKFVPYAAISLYLCVAAFFRYVGLLNE